MKCTELTTALGCFDDGAGSLQTVVAHYEYGTNAAGVTILVATRYTDIAGTPIDTSGGTVFAGECPMASPDVEWKTLCDVQADGSVVEFCRRSITSFDATGNATTVTADFETDQTTAYTITGTEGACNEDCDAVTAQGVLTTWG